jgi:lipopolysaccharide export LptBFGC system permease protein LptF
LNKVESTSVKKTADMTTVTFDSTQLAKIDSLFGLTPSRDVLQGAANTARQIKSQVGNSNSSLDTYESELTVFKIQWHKILASSLACVAMFLIGAPLGAIIKKGGLGVPFLVSILFFIIYYVLTMQGEKVAKAYSFSALALCSFDKPGSTPDCLSRISTLLSSKRPNAGLLSESRPG